MSAWQQLVIPKSHTVGEALAAYDAAGKGIVCVCDTDATLLGIITDGDFRRILGTEKSILSAPCTSVMNTKPIVSQQGDSLEKALHLMDKARSFRLLQLPVVDSHNRLVNVLLREEIPSAPLPKPRAVIMAGGFGRRLKSLTQNTPKPMLPVGGKPLLERIIERVRDVGITDITLSTHYLPEIIKAHFGDGKAFGVAISYVHEDTPLGTAGALSLLPEPDKNGAPLLVMNGDILSDIDLACMARQHYMKGAAITVATRQYEMQVPYGVINVDKRGQVQALEEKPTHTFQVSAGIYLLEPNVIKSLPNGSVQQMPDVITGTLAKGFRVDSFVIHEEWLDIGQEHDYHKAQELVKIIGK